MLSMNVPGKTKAERLYTFRQLEMVLRRNRGIYCNGNGRKAKIDRNGYDGALHHRLRNLASVEISAKTGKKSDAG